MQWLQCSARADGRSLPPSARFGHTSVAVDSTAVWGSELVVVFGGVSSAPGGGADQSDHHSALADVVVLQAEADAWFAPQVHILFG